MKQHPYHGYLTEPEWFSARNTARELISLDTWAQLAALGLVLFAIFVFAG